MESARQPDMHDTRYTPRSTRREVMLRTAPNAQRTTICTQRQAKLNTALRPAQSTAGRVRVMSVLLFLFCAAPVFSQGFMVNPMRIDVTGRAGQTLRVPLELRNTAGDRNQVLEIQSAHLGQSELGQWSVSSADPGAAGGLEVSARSWIEIPENRVDISPLEKETADILIRIPHNARGTYVAGLLVDSPPPPGATGIRVRMRFIIPVIVEIQGRPVRQQVSVTDVRMRYSRNQEKTDPRTGSGSDSGFSSTFVILDITNSGRTFPRIRGTVAVEYLQNERWRPVTRVEYNELGIVPGVQLSLSRDLERRLPSGTYRLRADLQVDGRRLAPMIREISFEGEPEADLLAYDQILSLDPRMLSLDVSPGATRTSIVTITNPSDEEVTVSASPSTPESLKGVVMGMLQGEALSAAEWIEIRPAAFTLRPNGRQSIRVISRVPREGVEHGHYYALLKLVSRYQDGQSAGEITSWAHLANSASPSRPEGIFERITLSELDRDAGQYAVSGRFINTGNVHLEPALHVRVLDPRGSERIRQELTGEPGYLLPLGSRDYGADMDFSGLSEGYYALVLTAVYGNGDRTVNQHPVLVERSSTGSIVVTILKDEDGPEVMPPDAASIKR
jgi:hypothetical protein